MTQRLRAAGTARLDAMSRWLRICAAALLLAASVGQAEAARVGVLTNKFFSQSAADFNLKLTGHSFTAVDVSGAAPTLASLTGAFDILLVFADPNFPTAPAVGDVAAAFANTGRAVVLGTFYDQQRSDAGGSGWGALEAIDPNTTDGFGVPSPSGQSRTLNPAATTSHRLGTQVSTLFATKWAGGNAAKPGTVVVAQWLQPNARGSVDPAIAYRITGVACVIHVGIAPHYATLGAFGTDFGGDFYRAWQNAFDFAATDCVEVPGVPALSDAALVLLALGLALLALRERRRLAAHR